MRAPHLREPIAIRALLIVLALGYIAIMLLLPLGAVLVQAFEKGLGLWWAAISDPDAKSAIWLTLTVAAISVPLNTIFGSRSPYARC